MVWEQTKMADWACPANPDVVTQNQPSHKANSGINGLSNCFVLRLLMEQKRFLFQTGCLANIDNLETIALYWSVILSVIFLCAVRICWQHTEKKWWKCVDAKSLTATPTYSVLDPAPVAIPSGKCAKRRELESAAWTYYKMDLSKVHDTYHIQAQTYLNHMYGGLP